MGAHHQGVGGADRVNAEQNDLSYPPHGGRKQRPPRARRRGRPLEYTAMEIAPPMPALALAKAKH
jgi:hypothetical protein